MSAVRSKLLALAAILLVPAIGHAQLRVITSGGFATAYQRLLPEFERTTGIQVITSSGASQGTGPNTIGAQLRSGAVADVVILSREGLVGLIAEGRIVAASDVDLVQTPIGAGVRAGAAKPDLRTVEAFKQTLLRAKLVVLPGSTTGIYLTTELLPRLGIADQVRWKVTARGSEATSMVASGEADLTLLPVSEILNVPGIELGGTIPTEIQYISVFAAAVVSGSNQQPAAQRLIAYLAASRDSAAVRDSGMQPAQPR